MTFAYGLAGPVWLGLELWMRAAPLVDADIEEFRTRGADEWYRALVVVPVEGLRHSGWVWITEAVFRERRAETSDPEIVRPYRFVPERRYGVGVPGPIQVHVRTVGERVWLRAVGRPGRLWLSGFVTLYWLVNLLGQLGWI
jgi:hypothetical protein